MMKILIGILLVILGIIVAAVLIILFYLFWFEAMPDFWRMITKKQDNDKFICSECGTKYSSPELTPPPGINKSRVLAMAHNKT